MNIKIVQGDALEELKKVKDKSVDCILTDPPYFLSKLDDNWKYKLLKEDKPNSHIKHLPKGETLQLQHIEITVCLCYQNQLEKNFENY